MIPMKLRKTLLVGLLLLGPAARTVPDEGMWTYDNLPKKLLKERYAFEPSQEWLDHVRMASVRFNSGGSGSFVGAHGLVMTNHHVALESVQKLSGAGLDDFVKNGFYAETTDKEIACPDLELNVLMSIENVTERVKKAENPRSEMKRIESEEAQKSNLRCDVVTLYNGGVYALYRYKQYTDVRLVWAPELAVGFYGGDPDNFTYPRFNLDCSFFRVYENGKPIASPSHLTWSKAGAKEGDLVFVSGHPGTTNRLQTLSMLEAYRDVIYPGVLHWLDKERVALREYAKAGEEQAREIREEIFGIENSYKALAGELDSLRDPAVWSKKKLDEDAFLATEAGAKVKEAVEKIAEGKKTLARAYPVLQSSQIPGKLNSLAEQMFEYFQLPKDNEAARKTAELALFSPAPIYKGMEEVLLKTAFEHAKTTLGADHPVTKALLGDKEPAERAKELVATTKLIDPASRKKLAEGGLQGLAKAGEPFFELMMRVEEAVEPFRAELRTRQGMERRLNSQVADARFLAYGQDVYPDATFTLRLSFGVVKGYEFGTTQVPYKTTFGGLYDRHDSFDGKEPWRLPERVLAARPKVDLSTPLNFVCTADIIGGNSGSPVVDREGKVVGLIFDGNIQSLGGNFLYDERAGRAVAVHSSGILEALRKIYGATKLADEITAGS